MLIKLEDADLDLGGGGGVRLTFSFSSVTKGLLILLGISRVAIELASGLVGGEVAEDGVKPICRSTTPRSADPLLLPFATGACGIAAGVAAGIDAGVEGGRGAMNGTCTGCGDVGFEGTSSCSSSTSIKFGTPFPFTLAGGCSIIGVAKAGGVAGMI